MSAFKIGDRVLVEGRVVAVVPGTSRDVFVQPTGSGHGIWLSSTTVHPAPKPLYVDPELVPGMVVAPLDAADEREWWVVPYPYSGEPRRFVERSGSFALRHQLPDEIRVVRPREATS